MSTEKVREEEEKKLLISILEIMNEHKDKGHEAYFIRVKRKEIDGEVHVDLKSGAEKRWKKIAWTTIAVIWLLVSIPGWIVSIFNFIFD